jgi:hypothetical protein
VRVAVYSQLHGDTPVSDSRTKLRTK